MLNTEKGYNCLDRQIFGHGAYTIRPVQPEDIEAIRDWRNRQMDVLRQSAEISPAQQQAYYERIIWPDMALEQPYNILFSLFREGLHIGYGGLVHIAWEHRRGEISFLVTPERAKQSELYREDFTYFLTLVTEVGFDHLGLNRLFTETYANRTFHMSILEAFGMRREGRMREHVLIDNMPMDSLIHGYLRSEYVE